MTEKLSFRFGAFLGNFRLAQETPKTKNDGNVPSVPEQVLAEATKVKTVEDARLPSGVSLQ